MQTSLVHLNETGALSFSPYRLARYLVPHECLAQLAGEMVDGM